MTIHDLFFLFRKHYERLFTTPLLRCYHNPSKLGVIFERTPTWIPLSYLMMMPAIMQDGTVCAKSIYVEDGKQRTRGQLVLYPPDGGFSAIDAVALTRTRSALMAALAIYYKGLKHITVGFIGTGPMNVEAWRVIHELFPVNGLILRGSRQNRFKNYGLFGEISPDLPIRIDVSPDGKVLREADVIVSCTSNTDPAEALPYLDLMTVPLVIVQDGNAGGIHFTQTLPGLVYVDHPEQSEAHWTDEFGDAPLPVFADLTGLQASNGPVLASLYGCAYFDGLLAQAQQITGGKDEPAR
jgi:hypothetical protein